MQSMRLPLLDDAFPRRRTRITARLVGTRAMTQIRVASADAALPEHAAVRVRLQQLPER
jgi:hypothetical protein